MKLTSIYSISILLVLLSVACDSEDKPSLKVDPTIKQVDYMQGTFTIDVTANVSWVAICSDSWCSLSTSGVGNGIILVTYQKNTGATPRTAEIEVSGYGVEKRIINLNQASWPLSAGLIAYYPFNSDASDQSGNENDGVVNGAVLTSDRNNSPNSAYSFNGSTSSITIPSTVWSDEMTISMWMYAKDFGSSQPNLSGKLLIYKAPDLGYVRDYTFAVNNENNQPKCFLIFGNSQTEYFYIGTTSPNLQVNQWYHIVFTRKAGIAKIYVNGTLSASDSYSFTPVHHNHMCKIGASNNSFQTFNGHLDDIRIYARAITAAEVTQLFNE